jgi:hypothetical protein
MQTNWDKSKLYALEVKHLGFTLQRDGFCPMKKWVDAILKLSLSTNVKKIRHLLGIINFIKNHIPN